MIPVTELDGAGHGQFSSDSFPSNFVLLNTFAEATSQPQPGMHPPPLVCSPAPSALMELSSRRVLCVCVCVC